MQLSRYLDHAVLKPEMTVEEAKAAIELGVQYGVRTVCVRPCDIELAKTICAGTDTEVSCVLDFPHGTGGRAAKAALAGIYAQAGAKEIDMVMNYAYARSGAWDEVREEIRRVVERARPFGALVKVIFETSALTLEQIKTATQASVEAGADFIKTSTGFSGAGAQVETVRAMLEAASGRISVKASGGIRDAQTARMYIDLGVKRLGVGYAATPLICG
ncbi:MAG: deoxyribose-phosphate aldolase [Bacillota bacterium]